MARSRAVRGGVRVEGLQQALKDLTAMGVEVGDLKDAFGKIAREAAQLAASLAPHRTGRLSRSIKGSRARNYAAVTAGSARIPYAGAINYGWRKRGIRPSAFMQRADMLMRGKATTDIQAAIARLIRAKGLA